MGRRVVAERRRQESTRENPLSAAGFACGSPSAAMSSRTPMASSISSVIDARRGEVFYGFYRQVPGGIQRVTEHRIGGPEQLASELLATGEECLAVGDGALRYSDRLRDVLRLEIGELGLAYPNAGSLVQLAHAQALREEFVRPWELEPVYLRKADAEINWTSRERT